MMRVMIYRYGFNGKENDNEVKGEGNQQDYGMRIYDPSLGRFLSVDPLTKKYPELTPYQFASNRPIDGIDLDGLEFLSIKNYKLNTPLTLMTKDAILKKSQFDNSSAGKFTNGALNTTFGAVGAFGSGSYIASTDGLGAVLGGTSALIYSTTKVGVGIAQMADAFSKPSLQNTALHQSSNLFGLVAYSNNNKNAGLIDAGADVLFGLGTIYTRGEALNNKLGFASLGIYTASEQAIKNPNLGSVLGAYDSLNSVLGLGKSIKEQKNSIKFNIPKLDTKEFDSALKSLDTLPKK
jgi:RHS repeat-associated protein